MEVIVLLPSQKFLSFAGHLKIYNISLCFSMKISTELCLTLENECFGWLAVLCSHRCYDRRVSAKGSTQLCLFLTASLALSVQDPGSAPQLWAHQQPVPRSGSGPSPAPTPSWSWGHWGAVATLGSATRTLIEVQDCPSGGLKVTRGGGGEGVYSWSKMGSSGSLISLALGKVWGKKGSRWVGEEQQNNRENGGQGGTVASKQAVGCVSLAGPCAWAPLFVSSD